MSARGEFDADSLLGKAKVRYGLSLYRLFLNYFKEFRLWVSKTQIVFTCSKSTIKTEEKFV